MKITCQHGYFLFREDLPGEIARFNSLYSQTLSAKDDYYTFQFLLDVPDFSILAAPLLNFTAIKNYCGKPWEIFEQNAVVYDFSKNILVPLASVTNKIELARLADAFSGRGMLQPGAIDENWQKVIGYQCHVNLETLTFNYSELFYA